MPGESQSFPKERENWPANFPSAKLNLRVVFEISYLELRSSPIIEYLTGFYPAPGEPFFSEGSPGEIVVVRPMLQKDVRSLQEFSVSGGREVCDSQKVQFAFPEQAGAQDFTEGAAGDVVSSIVKRPVESVGIR